jgi:murein DD-endopeptidase MepM/ murein hydrolase activator NlpD
MRKATRSFVVAVVFTMRFMCHAADDDTLNQRQLVLPIRGLTACDLHNTFEEGRANGQPHEAIDLLAPRGTPILAVEPGVIQKLFLSKTGGITIYEFDLQSAYCYYYAHLESYAEGLHEGMAVRQGEVIGYVGTSGNAPPNTPHLHFAIFKLGSEKHWWQGMAIHPYPVLIKIVDRLNR